MKKPIAVLLAALVLLSSVGLVSTPSLAEDPATLGQKVFKKKCFACHKVGDKAKPGVGPVLNDLFGRTAGTSEGFRKYTDAMKDAGANGLVWNAERLRKYLPAPRDYVTGTTMFFAGLAKPEDIENLIAYLRQFSPESDGADAQGNP